MSSDQTDGSDKSSRGGGLMGIVRKILPEFIRKSFAIKFGIALLIIGLSVGAAGFVGSELVKDEVHDQINDQYSNLAKNDANGLQTWVADNGKETLQLTRIFDGKTDTEVHNWLSTEKNQGGDYLSQGYTIHYVKPGNGSDPAQIVASTDGAPDRSSINPNENTTAPVSGINQTVALELADLKDSGDTIRLTDAYISDEGTSRFGGIHLAYIALVDDPGTGEQRAVIYSIATEAYTGGFTAGLGTGLDSGAAMVVDDDDQIIMEGYASSIHDSLHQYDQWKRPITEVRQQNSRVGLASDTTASGVLDGSKWEQATNYNLNGERYVVGAAPVTSVTLSGSRSVEVDWVVLEHTNRQTAYGDVEAVSNQSLAATLVGVLLIGIFGAVLGRNTSKSIDRLKGKAEEMEEGNLDVDLYSPRDDQIGQLYGGFANMRDALQQQIEEAEQARKEAEVSRAEAMEMSNYLQDRADEYAEIMQQCASGDLTRRMEPDGENEAMDRIASEFNEMIDELEKTTGQLKSFSDEVETAGEVVQTSSESVRDASEQVADSIQKISDDAYDQKERLQEISNTMDDIARDLEEFAAENDVDFGDSLERIEEIATTLNQVVELSEQTMAESENVAGAAEEQAAELNEVTQRAEDLSRYARPLREVLDRFETESEHEFYFPTGPGSGEANMPDDGQ